MQKRWMSVARCLAGLVGVMGCCGAAFAQAPAREHHVVFVISSADQDDWRSG